jgi:hypothetical protein
MSKVLYKDGCQYHEHDGTCSHPGKRGTKGADGKQYCRAADAPKTNKKQDNNEEN